MASAPNAMRSSFFFGLAPLTVFVFSLVGCGGAEEPPPPAGYVNVFWSKLDGQASTSATFLERDDNGCTVEESGPCRITTCPPPHEGRSVSAGTLHVRADSPAIARDITFFNGGYSDFSDRPRSAPPAGASLRVSIDGSPNVPAFAAELSYPELLVLTDPAPDARIKASVATGDRSEFQRSVRLPVSDTAIIRWTGGAPNVRFRLEGHEPFSSGAVIHSAECEAASTDGAIEIPMAVLQGMQLRAFTVVERHLTVGDWSFLVRLGGDVLVRIGDEAYVADIENQ